jgi:hypothetical protein
MRPVEVVMLEPRREVLVAFVGVEVMANVSWEQRVERSQVPHPSAVFGARVGILTSRLRGRFGVRAIISPWPTA